MVTHAGTSQVTGQTSDLSVPSAIDDKKGTTGKKGKGMKGAKEGMEGTEGTEGTEDTEGMLDKDEAQCISSDSGSVQSIYKGVTFLKQPCCI